MDHNRCSNDFPKRMLLLANSDGSKGIFMSFERSRAYAKTLRTSQVVMCKKHRSRLKIGAQRVNYECTSEIVLPRPFQRGIASISM